MVAPLIRLDSEIPNLAFELAYATHENFTGQTLYSCAIAFLRKPVAHKIRRIQGRLNAQGFGLKIFDAYRPRSVQRKLWKFLPDPRFIADPDLGSKHNRGAAIDLTLIQLSSGQELEMPTGFDDFSEKASPQYQNLAPEILQNRERLAQAMKSEGFIPDPNEWWHFNDCDWRDYPVCDVSFEELEGLRLFNTQHYFEAHETWEIAWKTAASGTEKEHLQGLILIASMLHLGRKGRPEAALRLAERAHKKLSRIELGPIGDGRIEIPGLDFSSFENFLSKAHSLAAVLREGAGSAG